MIRTGPREIRESVRLTAQRERTHMRSLPAEPAMMTFLVVLSLVLATAALGAVSGGGAGLALALFLAAVAAGVALSTAGEDSIAAPSA